MKTLYLFLISLFCLSAQAVTIDVAWTTSTPFSEFRGDIATNDTNLNAGKVEWRGSLTTAQRDALTSPVVGDFVYNSTAAQFEAYDGAAWGALGGGSGDALVANPLSQFAATTSLQMLGVISDETGTGLSVFNNSPTFIAPALGIPASGVATNLTGTASGLTAGNVTTNANLTGDVTSSGNAATIATGAVDVAMLANGTDGELITYDASGVATTVGVGTAAQVLTSNGAGAAPSFQAAAGGTVDVFGTPATNDFARWTDADTLAGRSYTETRTDLGLVIGTDVQAYSATNVEEADIDTQAEIKAIRTASDLMAAAVTATAGGQGTSPQTARKVNITGGAVDTVVTAFGLYADSEQTFYNATSTNKKVYPASGNDIGPGANLAIDVGAGKFLYVNGLDTTNARSEVSIRNTDVWIIAISDETTDLTTGAAKVTFLAPYAATITGVRSSVTTAPTSATLIIDINDGGTSIMTTNKLDILTTAIIDDATATLTDTAIAQWAVITIDIDQIGSGTAGAGAKVYITHTH